ncbi:MAG: hypothetical protein JWL80_508 [Parcubacteria group bacterium]|nr:hypothetical protein [Parcubacteria group bacterium]
MNLKFERIIINESKFSILLSLSAESLQIPEYVVTYAQKSHFLKKEELHITLIGYSVGAKLSTHFESKGIPKEEALHQVKSIAESINWNIEAKDEFYHLLKNYSSKTGKEKRETIIQMVDVPEIKDFVTRLQEYAQINLEVPPAHVTLFGKSTDKESALSGIGVNSDEDLRNSLYAIIFPSSEPRSVKSIALPTRPQTDTIIAIMILKRFGEKFFPGIKDADYMLLPRLPEGESEETLAKKGIILIDIGKGAFDHHTRSLQTTASGLIAEYLGVRSNPALHKLIQLAERCDFYGKGTISLDSLDRAFGISGLIGTLNKTYPKDQQKIIDLVLPIFEAVCIEEEKRTFEMPQEVQEKRQSGKAEEFFVYQRGVKLKCMIIESDNPSIAGFLRSNLGGNFDVVAIRLTTGHINILTGKKRPDLRSLIVLIRLQEAEAKNISLDEDPIALAAHGTLPQFPEWYYDTATNSLLNGGPNPQDVPTSNIPRFEFRKVLELGLSEQLWSPIS